MHIQLALEAEFEVTGLNIHAQSRTKIRMAIKICQQSTVYLTRQMIRLLKL